MKNSLYTKKCSQWTFLSDVMRIKLFFDQNLGVPTFNPLNSNTFKMSLHLSASYCVCCLGFWILNYTPNRDFIYHNNILIGFLICVSGFGPSHHWDDACLQPHCWYCEPSGKINTALQDMELATAGPFHSHSRQQDLSSSFIWMSIYLSYDVRTVTLLSVMWCRLHNRAIETERLTGGASGFILHCWPSSGL